MVKFSKELEAGLIPEWREAFVDYWQLKKLVKKIKLIRKPRHTATPTSGFLRPVGRISSAISWGFLQNSRGSAKGGDNSEDENDGQKEEDQHQLLHLFSEEDAAELFFERLDEEVKKVNEFYAAKEREFAETVEILKKQLQTLSDVKQILADRRRKCLSRLPCDSPSVSYSIAEIPIRRSEVAPAPGINVVASETPKPLKTKMEIPPSISTRVLTSITSMLWNDMLRSGNLKKERPTEYFIKRKRVECAEKMIRRAFVELYRGLGLLRNYRSLNMVAFVKIVKKFDKVSHRRASAEYLQSVKRSHFITSDTVVRVMDEVESIFVGHYADSDRKKAMKFLKPRHKKDSHTVTFFVGLFTGCFAALFILYAVLAHLYAMFSTQRDETYVDIVYPVFSIFTLFSLHVFTYGCNLLIWKRMRINYKFIFEFSPTTTLSEKDAFLICTAFMTIIMSSMVIHLVLSNMKYSSQYILGTLLMFFLGLFLFPLNVFYRPTRYFLLKTLRNIICSPFYKVLMIDFFVADQLTSQIPLLRHLQYVVCYFIMKNFRICLSRSCKYGNRQIPYVISFLPYYWRAMQCARRWLDECDTNHIANLGKYVSAMVAAGVRLAYETQPTPFWMWMVLVTSTIATIYQLYWDFIKDWGLLDRHSRNLWLRDELILKNKTVYYVSIVLNLLLRVAWVESVIRFNVGMFDARVLDLLLATLEVIRRGLWNFYRLENEHLNNVGKFRATKTVPLPFHDNDSDG